MIAQGISHTAYDTMKEYMLTGAELDGKYQIPMMDRYVDEIPQDTVDFKDSFSPKIKNHRELSINFYIHDCEFEKLWNNPDRYLEHLKCFKSVIAPDFSMAVGENGMPFAMNIWNKYRNHAMAHYLSMNEIKVIPNVSIPPEYCYDWAFDGVPKRSTVACCTNGRIKSRASREEFCIGFKEMERRIEPLRVIVVGKIPPELNTDVDIINFKTRSQKIKDKEGKYGV